MVRGSWRPNRTAIYWPPLLLTPHSYWPPTLQRCVFLVLQGCSTGVPGVQLSAGWWLFLLHLITNFSGPQLNRGPLRPGMDFLPQLVSYSKSNCLTSVLTELYNSSTPTQSHTQSLEWHVWSSSSGNNCHAVQRSLTSGASDYECIMGFFPCPILLARSTYAIFPHKCHRNVSLPSGASLWNGKFGRVEGQNTTIVYCFKLLWLFYKSDNNLFAQFYSMKYSNLIQIICIYLNGFKYSYLILLVLKHIY